MSLLTGHVLCSISNILRITVPRFKFLYQLVFFWKVFFLTYFLCSISSDLIQAVLHFHKVKESMLMYCRVWVFFRKKKHILMHISKSKKCGVSLSVLSTVNLRFLSNSLNAFNTLSIF